MMNLDIAKTGEFIISKRFEIERHFREWWRDVKIELEQGVKVTELLPNENFFLMYHRALLKVTAHGMQILASMDESDIIDFIPTDARIIQNPVITSPMAGQIKLFIYGFLL